MTASEQDPTVAARPAPLRRRADERMLTGLCAGLAAHAGITPVAVRAAALVALVLAPRLTVLLYTGFALLVPRDDGRSLLGGEPEDGRETVTGWALLVLCVPILGGVLGSGGLIPSPFDVLGALEAFVREFALGWFGVGVGLAGVAVAGLLALGFLALIVSVLVAGGRGGGAVPLDAQARETAAAGGSAPTATAAEGAPTRVLPASGFAPRRPRKPGPSLLLLGSAGVLAAACVLGLVVALGIADPGAVGVAVLLGLAALACTGAAVLWRERRHAGGLVALGALLAAGGWATGLLAPTLDAGLGTRSYRPVTVASIPASYTLGAGRLTVDLRAVPLPRGSRLNVTTRLRAGRVRILVPRGVVVRTIGPSGVSIVNGGGLGLDRTGPRRRTKATPRLTVSSDVGYGSTQVVVP